MKLVLNSSIQKLTGTMDGWVYRQRDGQTVVSRRPRRSGPQEESAAQSRQRDRFAEAIAYARRVLADPLQRQWYTEFARARGRRADKVLVSDYLTAPEIRQVDLTGYHGQPGDLIRAMAEDDIEVVEVKVTIATSAGEKLEEGLAARVHGIWQYVATTAAAAGADLRITLAAKDRPGNVTAAAVTYPE